MTLDRLSWSTRFSSQEPPSFAWRFPDGTDKKGESRLVSPAVTVTKQ
jgi:hypothetical protein